MSRLRLALGRVARAISFGPPSKVPDERPDPVLPGVASGFDRRRMIAAYLLAATLPLAMAAALIPVRIDHAQTTAIVLVVPVVLIAVLGAVGPGLVAAVSAGLAYDLMLTAPYYRLAIDDTDDFVATLTLVLVGLVVGLVTARLAREVALDAVRVHQLGQLTRFAGISAGPATEETLVEQACTHIARVLHLQSCVWRPTYRGGAHPVLGPSGAIARNAPTEATRAPGSPDIIEVPAIGPIGEIGRFVLTFRRDRASSREERVTVVAIAAMFATAHHRPIASD